MPAKLGALTAGLLLIGLSMVHAHDFSEAVAQARASGGGEAEEDIAKLDNDDNGRISFGEFKAYISGHTPGEIAQELELSPEQMQNSNELADSNQDNELTEQENNEFYRESLDSNGDNGVDKNELDDIENSITEPADH